MITAERINPAHIITRNCSFFRRLNFNQTTQHYVQEPTARIVRLPIPPTVPVVAAAPATVMQANTFIDAPEQNLEQLAVPVGKRGRKPGPTIRKPIERSTRTTRSASNQAAAALYDLSNSSDSNNDTAQQRSRSSSPARKKDALDGPYWRQ